MSDIFNDKEMELIDLASLDEVSVNAIIAALIPKLEVMVENTDNEDDENDVADAAIEILNELLDVMGE